ncbi:MAG TPA: hypothetical protein PLK31_16825 [Chloroflexota bacterium]|nr:hypothetical protein [Chloroflexota bacterium]
MINKRQTASAYPSAVLRASALSTSLCPNRRQRRRTIERAQLVLAQAEDLLLVAIFFIVFLYPLLLDPTLLFNLPIWLWWVKGFAWIGLLAWVAIRLLVGLPLAPAQITAATVAAMEQAAPEKELVSFTVAPVEIECTLFPWRQTLLVVIEQEANTQAQWVWRQRWRRPCRRPLFDSPTRRLIPPPSRSPEASA